MPRIDAELLDRRIKWGLLIVSLITLGLLAVAALRENVLAPWRLIRGGYAAILEEKATDEKSRALASQFEVRIVQNVLPELGTIDRCVTCHTGIDDPRMTAEKQPYRTHPGDYLEHHPAEKYGCTICHRGQGRALVFDEAKGEGHHWDYPLLPISHTQSSCGVCHTAEEVANKGGEVYAQGKLLYETKGCSSCHSLNGRGGSVGPKLDNEGLKVRGQLVMTNVAGPHTLPEWLSQHFDNPQKIVAGSLMKPPQLSAEENEALTTYMLSLQSRDLPRTYLSPGKHLEYYKEANPDPETGEETYNRYCSNCHDTGLYGRYDPFYAKFVPAIRGITFVQIASPEYIEQNILLGRPGTLMAAWGADTGGLGDEDITRVREFLLSRELSPEERLSAELLAQMETQANASVGDTIRGGAIFEKQCTGCHGLNGIGKLAPALINPVFQKTASAALIYTTIAQGRRNTAMPAFLSPNGGGLAETDIADLTAYVRSLGTAAPPSLAGQSQTVAALKSETRP